MKKTLLYMAFFSLFAFALTGCSNDDDYNADTAISYYKPLEYDRMVSSIAITSRVNGKDNSWTYNFVYDAQNRIKEIHGDTRFYENQSIKDYCEGTVLSRYFYNNETLRIECNYDVYVPKIDESINMGGKFFGCFDKEDGKLIQFDSFDCEYSGLMITKAYTDYGTTFGLEYDRNNNIIKTYQIDSLGNPSGKTIKEYAYSNEINKTNIDFASFLGYNIIERNVSFNEMHPYELFHLGAFGMLGGRGKNLPRGERARDNEEDLPLGVWVFDAEGYPTEYVSEKGRKYVIKYKE